MGSLPPGPVVIDDPQAARALTDLSLLPLLSLFLRGEASASEAAESLGADLDKVYYQVRKLERFGVLMVTRSETRAGRPIKHYRASADAFFVPFAVLPHETFERALAESAQASEERRAAGTARALLDDVDDAERWGFRVYLEPGGAVNAFWGPRDVGTDWSVLDDLLAPERPAVYGMNTSLALTHEESKALQRELHELMGRWMARARRNREVDALTAPREFLVGVSMAPDVAD